MGHFKFKILYSIVVLLGVSGIVTGQDRESLQKIDAVDAFLRTEEIHLQQDLDNNLWITTPVKLIRYNSANTQVFNKFTGIPSEIGKQYLSTYTDAYNKIWLAAEKGLAVMEKTSGTFKLVSNSPGRIYAMLEDEANQLWIAAENGIFKLKTNSNEADYSISRFLSQNTMATAVAEFNNHIVFAGPNGVLTINRKSGKFDQLAPGHYRDLEITSILPLNDMVLFGTRNNGLFKTNSGFKKLQKVNTLPYNLSRIEVVGLEHFNDEILLGTKKRGVLRLNSNLELIDENTGQYPKGLTKTFLDDKNFLWIVAKEGLFLKNFSAFTVDQLLADSGRYAALPDNFITASSADENSSIWIGHGEGLSIWNTKYNSWRHIKNLQYRHSKNDADEITSLLSSGNSMWVGTKGDGVYKVNINSLARTSDFKTKIREVNTLFKDGKGNIWIGGEEGYLTQIKPNSITKNFPIKGVRAIAELGPKQIIVGTKVRFHSLNPVTGRITDLEKLNSTEKLPYYSVNDIKITEDGMGIIATEGAGLIIYDFEEEEFDVVGLEGPLPSNNINAIEIASNDEFWLSTDKGLVYFNKEERSSRLFSKINGFSSAKLTTGFVDFPDGQRLVGSAKGLNIFNPLDLLQQNEIKPELVLKDLNVLTNAEDEKSNFQLSSSQSVQLNDENGFQITFEAISHLTPEAIRYSWKMEGLDEDWSEPAGLNSVSYAGLKPGDYAFSVKARLGDGGWTKPATIGLLVTEASGSFGAVYLFMGLGVLTMVGIFTFILIRRSKAADAQAKNEIREKLRKEFKAPVESAVNSLNKISSVNDPEKSEDLQRYAARFDELFNQILNFSYTGSVYEVSKIDLKKRIPKLTEEFKPVLDQKRIELTINDQMSSSEFYYNLEVLDKIFFSLISASTGYSVKKGKIIVNLIETSIGDLKLQITDNGRGIPLSHLKLLEKKNPVIRNLRFRDRNGIQNLLQAKEMVISSGGSFSYESEKNEGATFTVVLKNKIEEYHPVVLEEEKPEEIIPEKVTTSFPSEITEFSESKILIVENDTATRNILVNNIGKYCQIYQAKSAEEAIEKAGMIFPDVIITASVLPDMNAFQLSKLLKRNIGLNHINIFLVADEDQPIAENQLEELTEVIRKPVDVNLMLSRLAHVLKWQRRLRNSYVQSHIKNEPLEYRSESDEKFLVNLIDLIEQNIDNENFTVHDLSAKMSLSSNTLFMKLKSLIDLSPQDFMEFTRLIYARRLMETGDLNVMEVAYKSGFSSPKIFYNSFKKFFGYMPTDSLEEKSV